MSETPRSVAKPSPFQYVCSESRTLAMLTRLSTTPCTSSSRCTPMAKSSPSCCWESPVTSSRRMSCEAYRSRTTRLEKPVTVTLRMVRLLTSALGSLSDFAFSKNRRTLVAVESAIRTSVTSPDARKALPTFSNARSWNARCATPPRSLNTSPPWSPSTSYGEVRSPCSTAGAGRPSPVMPRSTTGDPSAPPDVIARVSVTWNGPASARSRISPPPGISLTSFGRSASSAASAQLAPSPFPAACGATKRTPPGAALLAVRSGGGDPEPVVPEGDRTTSTAIPPARTTATTARRPTRTRDRVLPSLTTSARGPTRAGERRRAGGQRRPELRSWPHASSLRRDCAVGRLRPRLTAVRARRPVLGDRDGAARPVPGQVDDIGEQHCHGTQLAGRFEEGDQQVHHAVVGQFLDHLVDQVEADGEGHQEHRETRQPPGVLARPPRTDAVRRPQQQQDRQADQAPGLQLAEFLLRQTEQLRGQPPVVQPCATPLVHLQRVVDHDEHEGDGPPDVDRAPPPSCTDDEQHHGRRQELHVAQDLDHRAVAVDRPSA